MQQNDNKELISFIKSAKLIFRKFPLKKIIEKIESPDLKANKIYKESTINFIIELVCNEFGITKDKLIEKQLSGFPKVPRTIAILLCTENLHVSDEELKIYFKIKHRQIIYYARKEFKNFNRNNKTDCKLFFETYDKLNIQLMDYIQNIKKT